ncbi:hypothetical protein [Burkholderia seminalis]|uniref:Uncharacterized protein n=1 Tax=Burkholderia seminalis TaxID=488731 RepID=A0A8A8DG66_9BURK|nr:hypothetical protein [Burkholderia seminalis]QTO23367.1 hypothetical protein DT99_035505 [Burkholderia seminalis]
MHTITQLRAEMFSVRVRDDAATIDDVFPDWGVLDRLGIVIDEPLGGLGASHLIQIAISRFYDASPRRRAELSVYPDIYAFHVGRGWGSHAAFDFWPARREVILTDDPCDLLDAINDRGITRLVVPDRQEAPFNYRPKEVDTALDRICTAFAYHPSGRTTASDVSISGTDRRTEINPDNVMRPMRLVQPRRLAKPLKESDAAYIEWMKARAGDLGPDDIAYAEARRKALRTDGLATETYRRIGVDEALKRLASRG